MTNEEKLMFKDLCARLPYGVKARGFFVHYNKDKDKIQYEECDKKVSWQDLKRYKTLKPYLRPMLSMTDEEKKEYIELLDNTQVSVCYMPDEEPMVELIDYLNANHFDYRGLIEKGLALEAPDGMYQSKNA